MNIQEYIASGIVELYVLGLTENEETAEFERLSDLHPEIRAAREAFEISLEAEAIKNAFEPPRHLKSKIFSQIEIESERINATAVFSEPEEKPAFFSNNIRRLKYLTAAAAVLLIISTVLNFYLFSKYQSYSARYNDLVLNQQQLVQNNKALQTKVLDYESALTVFKDPDMLEVKLPAAPNSPDPESFATVYWGKTSKEVYLLVKKMPAPPLNKQYQLWALVNSQPIDAGVFNIEHDSTLIKLKNIQAAEGFAVTLEDRGGSTKPSLDKMYVAGTIKT